MSQKNAKSSAQQSALSKLKGKANQLLSAEELAKKILSRDKKALAEAITLIESTSPLHRKKAQEVIQICLPSAGKSFRLGITGVPGVGKSSFIEAFGDQLIERGHKVAVLAIDPSSKKTKGSILGDKTRMQTLISREEAFIRPSPTSESLGGVAQATKESLLLCEAAGYDFIIIETVGVGQSETEVHSMVDFFLLLMLSGAGDELQGIKRGIMEMADALVITKADGDNVKAAKRAKAEYKNAIHLLPAAEHYFPVEVSTCSALEGEGLEEIYELLLKFKAHTEQNGYFHTNRQTQNVLWMKRQLKNAILENFFTDSNKKEELKNLEKQVKDGKISPFQAVERLIRNLRFEV